MGVWFSRDYEFYISQEELLQLRRETGFSKQQMNKLLQRFRHLDKQSRGFLTRKDLLSIKEIALNPVGEKIVEGFFEDCENKHLYFEKFARTFAIFRPLTQRTEETDINSTAAKIDYLFDLLDSNNDGYLCRKDIRDLLELMMGAKVTVDQLDSMALRVLSEVGGDVTGQGTEAVIARDTFKHSLVDLDVQGKMAFVSLKKGHH